MGVEVVIRRQDAGADELLLKGRDGMTLGQAPGKKNKKILKYLYTHCRPADDLF